MVSYDITSKGGRGFICVPPYMHASIVDVNYKTLLLIKTNNDLIGAPERGHPENCDRSNHSKPPIPVRYTPGSSRVKTHTLDEELPQSTNTKEHMTQPGLYHAMGPDTSLAKEATIYTDDPLDHVYQYADAGLHYYSENTTGAAQVGKTLVWPARP